MAIIVFQHSESTGPGRLGMTLRELGFKLDIRRPDLPTSHPANRLASGQSVIPADYDNVHGVIAMGGPQNIGEPHPWLEAEAAYIRGAHQREIPVIGICLGAQLIAHALGGKVSPLPDNAYEVGILPVSLNPAGQTETIFAGIPWEHPQFHHHGFHVEQLPPGAMLLASSKRTKVQAFKVGVRTYGFQYHPECDRGMIDAILKGEESCCTRGQTTMSDVLAQTDAQYAAYARASDRLCVNLATYLFPLNRKLTA
jgi:GMP synthase (glutamine-hydrolysing)